jgi:hypothetical protein
MGILKSIPAWLLLGLALVAGAPCQTVNEYQAKAAYLYNFGKFVEWPPEALPGPADPIETCVLGRDPFGHWLKDSIAGKSIGGHPLEIRHVSSVADAGACQILFVSASEPKRVWSAISAMKRPGILTVGECSDPAECGAIINFTLENDKLRFEIDSAAAELAKLKISSRLLSLAQSVKK